MSENILKALMQLFAIIADPRDKTQNRRFIVHSFLKQQLNTNLLKEYIDIFDFYRSEYQKKFKSSNSIQKKTSANSVKVLKICTEINKELTQFQKFIVIIRLLEFINSNEQELEFVKTVASAFNINNEEYSKLVNFILTENKNKCDTSNTLVINSLSSDTKTSKKHIYSEFLQGQIFVHAIESADMYIFKFKGEDELFLNNQLLEPNRIHILSEGASIKNPNINSIYYSDIVSKFQTKDKNSRVILYADNISYKFNANHTGIHSMSFSAKSGNLTGVIGASGSGKSTLLNLLNGNLKPTTGKILLNGINVDKHNKKIRAIIGHVAQDDVLFEDLTVFQNLYYSAKLCFDNLDKQAIVEKVNVLLGKLGLYEVKDLKVGSPIDKKISGGQRKRLNIALELIREPSVLFLDEPTSGLSSRDSELILDLLKDLSLKGKLVFLVIHQPSSDIFKKFDKLLVLDKGGYLIYAGDPVESIHYFKTNVNQADRDSSECIICGNVNVEQIFNIVEAQVVNEYGVLTQTRKIHAIEWYNKFIDHSKNWHKVKKSSNLIPKSIFKIPNRLKQIQIYIQRDVSSKLARKQYMLVNILEIPLLAFILSYITRYYNVDTATESSYNLMDNSNLPVYLFMSVIVALFVGLTVSAQEIVKDNKILKRESFLNLSRTSYLLSKITILSILSAYQSFIFVIIGNYVMGIHGMLFQYWAVLFSTFVCANLMGLNLSDGFVRTVTIFIVIPFVVIPHIILSGVIVKFDKINPSISYPNAIPFYGEMIVTRWAYEALAVYQFKNNNFEKHFYHYDKAKSIAEYKTNYWLKVLENKLSYYELNKNNASKKQDIEYNLTVLQNEIRKESINNTDVELSIDTDSLKAEYMNKKLVEQLNNYFNKLRKYYNYTYKEAVRLKDIAITQVQTKLQGEKKFLQLKKENYNRQLANFVSNSDDIIAIKDYKGWLYQKIDPIYHSPDGYFLKAHFYAPNKPFFGKPVSTLKVNISVIWLMSLLLYITLYYRLLKKIRSSFNEFKRQYVDKI